MNKLYLAVTIFLLTHSLGFTQASNVQEVISEERVAHLLRVLSADSMMGRKAFTPSARKSAHFISEQYQQAGLEPLPGEADHLQRFSVYSLVPSEARLQLNGAQVSPSAYFISSNHEVLRWNTLSDINKVYISREDDFRESFIKLTNSISEHTIVVVSKTHREIFTHFARYFSSPSKSTQINDSPAILCILTDDTVETGSFSFSQDVQEQEAFNVAGQITGTSDKDEYVIFSAHYDHIGVLESVDGDSIANGADDNASGTTSVITLAEYFARLGPQSRTLVFVTFTAEEMGGFGSRYFSRQIDPDQVMAMFNIEMIGKPSRFGPNTAFMTGFEKTNMGEILQQDLKDTPYRIFPDPYPDQNLFFRSDNATLARLGVPAHTISSVQIDQDQYYHTVNDEFETLDIEHLTNMIRAIALSSGSITSGSETPSRLNPSSLR